MTAHRTLAFSTFVLAALLTPAWTSPAAAQDVPQQDVEQADFTETFFNRGARIAGCDSYTPWGQGETSKPSDTRNCRGGKTKSFVPGLKQRAYVANLKASVGSQTRDYELLDGRGNLISRGVKRPGTPNGRTTVDFPCPSAAGLRQRYGEVILRLIKRNGTTECKGPFNPNSTIRNGQTVPNRAR